MTSLQFAITLFKSEILKDKVNVKLMFDEHNPTAAEEIIQQQLETVLLKPVGKADEEALLSLALQPVSIQLTVN